MDVRRSKRFVIAFVTLMVLLAVGGFVAISMNSQEWLFAPPGG